MFAKSIQKADHIRRYTIKSTHTGWEVRQEQDSKVVHQACYHDWHRVERARRAFAIEVSALREQGWQEL
jgi:hypothetical protein